MKLTEREKDIAKDQGAIVSSKCDACGRVLNYLRYTIHKDDREFCLAAERDQAYYSAAELAKLTAAGTCIHCRAAKDVYNTPYCVNCRPVADPQAILTISGKRKKYEKDPKKGADSEELTKQKKPRVTSGNGRRTRNSVETDRPRRSKVDSKTRA